MKYDSRKYRITFTEMILGGQPSNPDVRTKYVMSLAPEYDEEEAEMTAQQKALRRAEDADEKSLTVFLRNPRTGALCEMNYMVRGFLKSAFDALKEQNGVLQSRSKIDKYVHVFPRMIDFHRPDGSLVKEPDENVERPLRAQTMQGPRVTLTASESINAGCYIDVEITLHPNGATGKSKPITWEAIEDALDYGKFTGIGQWRTGSYGTFEWERLDDKVVAA